jgi:hypothetical protein
VTGERADFTFTACSKGSNTSIDSDWLKKFRRAEEQGTADNVSYEDVWFMVID